MDWNGREKSQPVTVGIGDGVDGEDGKLIAVRDEKNVNAVERIGFFFCGFCAICWLFHMLEIASVSVGWASGRNAVLFALRMGIVFGLISSFC